LPKTQYARRRSGGRDGGEVKENGELRNYLPVPIGDEDLFA
jgi:hypothetical protein